MPEEVILSLKDDPCTDVREIVAPLIREARAGAREVAPAPAPDGRGSEPSPAVAGLDSEGRGEAR
jgi:hypothetical protein